MTTPIKSQLVVFDFDWSMADQDTDRWIFEVLAPDIRRKMKTLQESVQWTDLMSHPAMVRGVTKLKGASNPTTTFFCLSNANSVFISTILESKGLQNLFEEIVTNPAEFDPSGLLKLHRRVDPNGPQHSCAVGCSPNMCKGEELTAFLERHKPGYDRIIYVGDGSNDFCPILRLRSQDMVLCRRFRGLEHRISQEGGLQCQVKYWAGAWEVEEIFNQLIE
ncbi:putative phosphatase-domain-containing protein [Suillus ampliporus]|nr:putative phosphatase-domain-containing protein [Suillus ampliporus]